ncbi:MAG: BrnA antitoxin family protein [Sulfurifustis sp.]
MSKNFSSKRSKATRTDWKHVDALRDEEIDLSDNPEVTPEMFAKAVVRRGLNPIEPKEQVTLRLDADVLKWFRSRGRGYQTQINALLRAYMEAHRNR